MQDSLTSFRPEYPAPGENLKEILDSRGIKVVDFAQRCGRPTKTISEIISGDTAITPETALQFQHVLMKPAAETWIQWESAYRLRLAELKEEGELEKLYGWATSFPLKELSSRNLITLPNNKIDLVKEALGFFGVSSLKAWKQLQLGQERAISYRKTKHHKGNDASIAAWLRIGYIKAAGIDTPPYDEKKFKETLPQIRALTFLEREEFEPTLIELCKSNGVALVIVDELKGTRLSGAARWITKDKPLIQLSTRYSIEDQFWFSFFHEAGHILLHSKKALFIDEDDGIDEIIETEADRFAENCLLPSTVLDSFYERYGKPGSKPAPHTEENIRDFAEQIGVSPGIVLAQMQRRYPSLYRHKLNKILKRNIRNSA